MIFNVFENEIEKVRRKDVKVTLAIRYVLLYSIAHHYQK